MIYQIILLFILKVIQAFSDGLYASPAVFSARNFFRRSSKQKTTFFYHFSHHTKMGLYNQVINELTTRLGLTRPIKSVHH